MERGIIRDVVLDEIKSMPEDMLSEIYSFIRDFKKQGDEHKVNKVMRFAGCWNLSEDEMNVFLKDIQDRRSKTFLLRRGMR